MAGLILGGKLCRSCSPKHCKEQGSDQTPLEIECPSCNGCGCDDCKQGMVKIEGCPQTYIRQVIPVVKLKELFNQGLPPVAGGVLDQSAWFMEACKILDREEQLNAAEEASK